LPPPRSRGRHAGSTCCWAWLAASPLALQADTPTTVLSVLCGVALIGLSLRRGPIRERYGDWTRLLV